MFRWATKVERAYPRPLKFLHPLTGHIYLQVLAINRRFLLFGVGFVRGCGARSSEEPPSHVVVGA